MATNWMLAAAIAVAASTTAHTQAQAQSAKPEDLLADLEFRTSNFISGKEKFQRGMTELPANLRPAVCKAFPVKTNADTIARFKRRIELLETPENAAQLDAEQKARLDRQKEDVQKLTPDIDCANLQ